MQYPTGRHLPSASMVAKARDARWFGVPFRDRRGPDADGWQEATVHASALHVGRSAVALGGVAWRRVRHMAAQAEDGQQLSAKAVFRHLGGKHSCPERMLLDQRSLSAAYAGLLTNCPLQLRWQEESFADAHVADEERLPDAVYAAEAYGARSQEAATCVSGPCGMMLGRRPLPASRREVALLDPQILLPARLRGKPRWSKAWVFAKLMRAGEEFPPVSIAWCEDTLTWRWRDGCHRYFGALVSGRYLPVSFKDPTRRSGQF